MAKVVMCQPDIDSDDAEENRLVACGRKAWAELSKQAKEWKAEVSMLNLHLEGTADVVGVAEKSLVIIDWKSGWSRRNHHHQLAGYATLAKSEGLVPDGASVTTVCVWLRSMEIEVESFTQERLDAWADMYRAQVDKWSKEFCPGEHCGYCPHVSTCEARAAFVRGACEALSPISKDTAMTPEVLASLYDRSVVLQRALDSYRDALRSALEMGTIELSDGRRIGFREESRQDIDARKAWPILRAAGLSDEDLGACVKVGKSKLLDIIGEHAPPRQKGKAKAELMEKLEKSGAVTETTIRKIGIVKTEKTNG